MVRRLQIQADIGNDGTPSKKRRKLEKLGENASTAFASQHAMEAFQPLHAELWWHDGNVIIAADQMSFKLHASVLERHSSVFSELLNDAQARHNPPELFEGCRVLRVDDKGVHLAELFRVLYDGGGCVLEASNIIYRAHSASCRGFFDWRKPIEFTDLRRITLVAIKYKVQHIIDEAVVRLEYLFPTSFDPDRLDSDFYIGVHEGHPVHCPEAANAIGVAALARAIDHENPPPFIVMALYRCTSFDAKTLLDLQSYDEQLASVDLSSCLGAITSLETAVRKVRGPVADALDKPMCSSKVCHSGMKSLVCEWIRSGMFSGPYPLSSCERGFRRHAEKHPNKKVCKSCEEGLIKAINERRRELFADLGKIFNISTWPAGIQAKV
ncbi:uncharacterized protein PHACADRAFT_24962 [Phanerochaete carnosa HHB-10118-sp]|uniref:BTB domain-containing protein n=1 Tax=Phanerochaete carnosa (strain HHB-10118-sp) TaxID=650164 RepID=K5WQV6_PHACS|nr:uncharacterized protein PHACADRAFT_24962 [Phanerochaete carnosa HHB-10118-sp]EKM61830.1 hypothetical protein PHACADRAFT_24962 [Phanerochaete carnosa HHB-10118-sp]